VVLKPNVRAALTTDEIRNCSATVLPEEVALTESELQFLAADMRGEQMETLLPLVKTFANRPASKSISSGPQITTRPKR
jgi:hypothetical protein